ncbi:GNAT family N-acetyltransferase [Natranaeroarchaeum sulfidigenes]|uniref:Acetyltransferase, GNAT superfamily n=1 Tax=Natranaeroarchaeum sulfidigenes TaxID=2784880 RepID=A0A897MZ57_9EURY|nr:GNAT family N-acetyltransferase [Natranaeroarchaeum sulfidigenes]QSG03406.1 Acetyltransferase, GNAT superfamily [Natranaeroarchaeum sulfidigenes]
MTDFRSLPAEDRQQFRSMLRYAFTPERGPLDAAETESEETELFDRYGLYDDNTLVSGCKLYTPEARIRDEITTIGGLGAVATLPEFRGKGYGRQLCLQVLSEYRKRGIGLVALWPFSTPFYRRMGWGTANKVTRYELPPRALPMADTAGRMRRIDGDDWKELRAVERRSSGDRSLALRRSETWWRERTLANWTGDGAPFCYGYERDGQLQGYLVYTVGDDDKRTLTVSGFVAADEEAYRALFDFLSGHGAQIERIVGERALGTDLLSRVEDPAAIDCTVEPGPMVRLTDVEALEAIEWPAEEIECTLAVSDPLVADNEGVFELSVSDGRASIDRVADSVNGQSTGTADATIGIGTLSQLAVGTYGLDEARRLGDLRILDESVRTALGAVFEPRAVGLREFF